MFLRGREGEMGWEQEKKERRGGGCTGMTATATEDEKSVMLATP